jgi:hypothetical protein
MGKCHLFYRPLMGFYVVGFQPPSLGTNFLGINQKFADKMGRHFPPASAGRKGITALIAIINE